MSTKFNFNFFNCISGISSEYTPFGNYVKAIGENENAAAYLGIKLKNKNDSLYVIWNYGWICSGIFVIARSGGASPTTASGMEMNVMMAIFVGGVPVTGGTASKIYKLILWSSLNCCIGKWINFRRFFWVL